MIQNQYKATPKSWMSDVGGEYKSKRFLRVLADHGIKVDQSVPHTPQQNGRAERFNQTIMDKAESMRHDACLPDKWWNFAIEHTVRLYNRTFMERLKKSPFEAMHGSPPDLSNLKIFGCGAYVFLPSEIRKNKLAPKSEMMIHLGIEDRIKGYRFMRLPNNVLFYSAKALFNKDHFLKCRTQIPKAVTCLPESSKRATRSSSTPPALPTFYYPPNNPQDWPQPPYPPAGMPLPAPPLQAPGPPRGWPTLLRTP